MALMIRILLSVAGTVTVEMHDNAEIVGCAARPTEGLHGALFQLYTLEAEADTMGTRTFTLTRVGDALPSGDGWFCYPGFGLPPMWLTEV